MSKQRAFFEYLRTFLLTLLAVFISVIIFLGIIQHQVYDEQQAKTAQEDTIDYYLVGLLIDKNKYLEEQDPDNYKINLKLALLYQIKGDFKNSESEYKIAISKAPFDEFGPEYKLALLYLMQNRLDDAEKLMNSIDERPNKKLIGYKGDIFSKLGDKYYDKADYEDAISKYRKSLSYYEIIKSKKIKTVKNSMASTYVYLAEEKVKELQIDDAIELLEMAKSIVDAPIIKYKLALLLMQDNPDRASKYFEEVFKEEPSIINYEGYYKFLSSLAEQADKNGEFALAELYRHRIKKIEEYYQSNILYVEDLKIDCEKSRIKLNNWKKKYNISLNLRVKNVSGYAIKSLYLFVIFKDKNEIIDSYTNEIASDKYFLRKDAQGPLINIKASKKQTIDDEYPKEVVASIYASKQMDGYKLHLQDIVIRENAKRKRHKVKLFFLEFYLPEFLS